MTKRKSILLVDDDVIVSSVEKQQLEKIGYLVYHVYSGEDAVQVILEGEKAYDLILMDIDLGHGMDGTQTAEKILEQKDIPILFLSSHTEPEIVEKTEKITSYGYVVKNSGLVILDASIKMAIKLFESKIERKNAEERLRVSEKKFRNILENVDTVAVQGYGSDGTIHYWNRASENLYGYSEKEAIGSNLLDLIIPEKMRDEVSTSIKKMAKSGKPIPSDELLLINKSGFRIPVISNHAVVKTPEGEPELFCLDVDISERKEIERNLYLKECIITSSISAIATCDLDGNMTYGNPYFENLWGFTKAEEYIGVPFRKLWQVEDQYDDIMRTFAVGESWSGEVRGIRKDGSFFDVHVSATTVYDKDGSPIALTSASIDITEQKNAEKLLSDSEERFNLAMAVKNEGIWDWHVVNDEVFFDNRYYTMAGYEPLEFAQKFSSWSERVHPEDISVCESAIREYLAGKTGYFDVEFRFKRKDESWMWIQGRGKIVERDEYGSPLRIVGTHTDITRRKLIEKENQKQLAEKELLLREVHHRVKNNIANIVNLLSFQVDTSSNMQVKSALKDAASRVQSMRILYDRLLVSEDLREISVKNYVDSLIDSLVKVFFDMKNISIKRTISDFNIATKKAVIIGIIINELLTNVFKYAFKNRDQGSVLVSLEKIDKQVVIIIQDNGIGIEERAGGELSTGFGLTIVKMLVEQLNGTKSVVNECGTKTVIQFEL